jgi:hypothetical protein
VLFDVVDDVVASVHRDTVAFISSPLQNLLADMNAP